MSKKKNTSKSPEAKASATPAPKATKKAVSLADAQAQSKANMQTSSASFGAITAFLSKKSNQGKYFSPTAIATAIGEGVTDKSVRKTLQKQGLAANKQGVIESGNDKLWLALAKQGNKNTYCAFPAETAPPAVAAQ